MRTIAVLNQKGGVGKTTTTVNTAAALAALGMRVVAIDLDPQAHLTIHLGVEPQTIRAGSYGVLTQSAEFEQSLMLIRPNLWLLGANINLVGAETELVSVVGREIILREAMSSCQAQFDFCLIDCAPSLGLLSLNALAASQEVLIPLQPHFLALQGFGKLLQTVDLVNKRINRDLKVSGVLLCMFDTRASLPNEVRADIDRFLTNARGSDSAWAEAQLVPTFIRRNIKLAEAPSYGQTIFEYDPTCNGAADYKNVARFFLGIKPQTDDHIEPETEAEPGPQAVVESEPVVEHEPQEGHCEPESFAGPEPVAEPTVDLADPPQEICHDPSSPAGPEPVADSAVEGEGEQPQREPEAIARPELVAEHGAESGGESQAIQGEPEPGSEPAVERHAEPESQPWEMHHQLQSAPTPEPAVEGDAEPADRRSEMHEDSELATGPDPVVPAEQPPLQIRAVHLPAPQTYSPRPFHDEPVPPALQAEPSPGPHETRRSHDEPEQVGL